MYLFDSDIFVRILRNRSRELVARLNASAADIFTSVVVRHELIHGALMSSRPIDQQAAVDRLLARVTVLEFNAGDADHAADIKADLQRTGRMIGANDLLIAGHARNRSLIVVTGNLREFGRVSGLRCEDWPAGPPGPYLS